MSLDVPDDYQIPSRNPEVFWEDLKEKAGEQIEVDLFDLDEAIGYEFPLFNFIIYQMFLDQIEQALLPADDGSLSATRFDHVHFNE